MPGQKREKSGTGICHVMQGQESKTCSYDSSPELQVSLIVSFNGYRMRFFDSNEKGMIPRSDGPSNNDFIFRQF